MVSHSQLTVPHMPQKLQLMSELDAEKQPDTDRRTSGAQTGQKVLGNFADFSA